MARKSLIDQFFTARRVSVPLVAIQSPDQMATVGSIVSAHEKMQGNDSTYQQPPIFCWDVIRGFTTLNEVATQFINNNQPEREAIMPSPDDAGREVKITSPVDALFIAGGSYSVTRNNQRIEKPILPPRSILFMLNAQRYLGEQGVNGAAMVQAINNLRDRFKENTRMLVMLAPEFRLPIEIAPDVLLLDEPYPATTQLAEIIGDIYQAAIATNPKVKTPSRDMLNRQIDALLGLPSFTAEQSCALSFTDTNLDIDLLWERKRQEISQTPGLGIYRGTETYSDVKGCDNLVEYLKGLMTGGNPPSVIVFMDEIEKMFAGLAGDLSGTTQEMTGPFLSWCEEKDDAGELLVVGVVLIGPGGTGKSLIAKATGNEFKRPTITCDISKMKDQFVGTSQQNMGRALKTLDAVSGGRRKLILATSNNINSLPPEFKRRFSLGTFYVDLPTAEARNDMWKLYTKRYGIADKDRPVDDDWTGAEIRNCCMNAKELDWTLKKAAQYIVPIAESDGDKIEALRALANGRFISASRIGKYQNNGTAQTETKRARVLVGPGKGTN